MSHRCQSINAIGLPDTSRLSKMEKHTWEAKTGLAQMLKGGMIMDVVNREQSKIAEDAGACAVMALERTPAHIRVTPR